MAEAWSSEIFYQEIRHLLKRYFPSENGVSPDDVEVRATWKTSTYAYCVFSVKSAQGLAYVGMEFALIPRHTLESGESYSSEGRTAVTGWGDQLAGNAVAPYLDYGSDDKIEWIGGERDYDPKHFAELEKMKSEGADIYLSLATHD